MKRLITILIMLCGLTARSATTYLADGVLATVQTAVNAAAMGDKIIIPAGSNTWTGVLYLSNRVWVCGSGVGQTIIKDAAANTATYRGMIMQSAQDSRLSDITFYQDASLWSYSAVCNYGTRAVIERCNFMAIAHRAILAGGNTTVIADCYFQTTSDGTQQGIQCWGNGTNAWWYASTWGSTNRTLIEDCIFDFAGPGDASIEGYFGAEMTIRYCQFTNCTSGMHGLDSGSWASGGSTKDREFYKNVTTLNVAATILLESRGGNSLAFSNWWYCSGSYVENPAIQLEAYRSTTNPATYASYDQGNMSGSNRYDGNILTNGWMGAQLPGTTGPFLGDGYLTNQIGVTNTIWPVAMVHIWENYYVRSGVTNAVGFSLHNVWQNALIEGRDYTNAVWSGLTIAAYPSPLRTSSGGGAVNPVFYLGVKRE